MSHNASVVVLHAHPDDESIFTGATVRALADAGLRVVLVVATDGGQGVPRVPLRPGETIRDRRLRELETAAGLLGAAALHVLPWGDSGCHAGPFAPGTLGAARVSRVAARVRRIAETEGACAVVHDDHRGIYGHVDHVRGHLAGAVAARDLGLTAYRTTVDAGALRRGPRHVLQQAAGEALDAGVDPAGITLTVRADDRLLGVKLTAMAAHSSQIGPEYLDPAAYRHEWFVRVGAPTAVDDALAPWLVPAAAASPAA